MGPNDSKPSPDGTGDDSSSCSNVTSYHETPSRNWFQRVLLRNAPDEWEYEDIEAYIFNMRQGEILVGKLPLSDKDIKSNLRKLTKPRFWKQVPGVMEQYASLDWTVRQDLDKGIATTKARSSREMTLVAMTTKKMGTSASNSPRTHYPPDLVVTLFFMLGAQLGPIFIIAPDGFKCRLPYTSCQSVQVRYEPSF